MTAATITLAVIVLFLATYRLTLYPTIWFDEGEHLHVPKTLVQAGQYADISSEGFRYFGPTVGVGPMVMIPIALAFKLGGIGLLQARLVMALYLLSAAALFLMVARRLFGGAVALLATAFLVTTPSLGFIETGRQVLGEVPAFAFLLLGVLLWWRAAEPGAHWGSLLGAGIAFGLAGQTKNDLGMILVPTFLFLFALDRFHYRQLTWRHFAVPLFSVGVGVASGYLVLLPALLSSADPAQFVTLFRNASAGAIFVFSPSRNLSALKFLTSSDVYAFWGIPAIFYGWVIARERSLHGLRHALLLTFAVIGLTWFAFVSIGWARYAFSFLGIGAIYAAKLLSDLISSLRTSEGLTLSVGRTRINALATASEIAVTLVLLAATQSTARAVLAPPNTDPQQMAAYLNAHVSTADVVETWEPELGFLTNHRYHYPPPVWLDHAVRAQWLGTPLVAAAYDPISEADPAYLVVGPFAKYTGIYNHLLARQNATPIASLGQYDLYRLR
jgi:4-amino-4-deoxy-L-arabinose transferase-like glycosyltransferase